MGQICGNTLHLKQDTAWLHLAHIVVNGTLTFTHTHLGRFGRNRFVGKNTDPNFAFTLHITCKGNTGSLDLTAGQAAELHGFERERAERNGTALVRETAVAALMLLAIFLTFGLKHRMMYLTCQSMFYLSQMVERRG